MEGGRVQDVPALLVGREGRVDGGGAADTCQVDELEDRFLVAFADSRSQGAGKVRLVPARSNSAPVVSLLITALDH
jgi:hypothetical protein